MTIGGVSLILILGISNSLLLLFQLLSGLRVVKVPPGVHRKSGVALCVTGGVHAILALLV